MAAGRRVCVVGAGPVGSLMAVLWARRGATVYLLEARSDHRRRLGGEWLHPAAVDLLDTLGVVPDIVRPGHATGRGFVVLPEDGSPPIELPYPGGRFGTSVEHGLLVAGVRQAAIATPGVTYLPNTHPTAINGHTVEFAQASGDTGSLSVDLIIGADGRGSRVRQWLFGQRRRRLLSCMAGVLLEGVTLPHEGFGHVLVGGPGPMLAYRLDERTTRVCVDLPAALCKQDDLNGFLSDHYTPFLPVTWREPFVEACASGQLVWARNESEPRAAYGEGPVRLVGDAVGCHHPITASGMTLGFGDAATLVEHPKLHDYQARRRAACDVPQALASSLYAALAGRDEPAMVIRRAIYHCWRSSPVHRRDTVRLLCCEDASVWAYRRMFLQIGAMGLGGLLREIVASHGWRQPTAAFGRIGRQLRWFDDRLVASGEGDTEAIRVHDVRSDDLDRPGVVAMPRRHGRLVG